MKYEIRNIYRLKQILWIDFLFGSIAGVLGLVFVSFFAKLLNLPRTVLYAVCAFYLAQQNKISILFLRLQINANWFWTFISFGLFVFHFNNATKLGLVYLFSQIFVVGILALLEGNQLQKNISNRDEL